MTEYDRLSSDLIRHWQGIPPDSMEPTRPLGYLEWEETLAAAVVALCGRAVTRVEWMEMSPVQRSPWIRLALDRAPPLPPIPEGEVEGEETEERRPCYERDHLWLRWNEEEGLGPAGIRDRWNEEYPQEKIGSGESGRDLVKKGLIAARKERDGE